MLGEYDKTRWFDLLKTGSLDEISNELLTVSKSFLLSLTDNSSSLHTCLFYAIQDKDTERGDALLALLLREGVDCTTKDALQQTGLFYAARFGNSKQITMLAEGGADPNHKDNYGQTALYYCAREGYDLAVKALLQLGADPNLVDNLGQTPIFYACREAKMDTSQVLIEHGAHLNQCDKMRNTPLSWAKRSGNALLVEHLLANGALDRAPKKKKEAEPRKKEEKKKSEKKMKCQLMIVDDCGEKYPATEEELRDFEEKFPQLARFWLSPGAVTELDTMDSETIEKYKPWERLGKKLMNILWRNNNSWIFYEKVDPMKLGIPDYCDLVKEPMDFGTIKRKLNNNVYATGQEMIRDFELVFANCMMYNPPESDVHGMCLNVKAAFEGQVKFLGLNIYSN